MARWNAGNGFFNGIAAIAPEYELDRGLQGLYIPTFIEGRQILGAIQMGFEHVVPKRATKIKGGWPYWIIGVIASNAFVEEKAMAVFQPDTLIPDQFRNTYKRKAYLTPEKTLMLGVLQDAVICFQDHVGSRDKKKRAVFLERMDPG